MIRSPVAAVAGPEVPVAQPSAKKTEADAGTASTEKADGEEGIDLHIQSRARQVAF